MMQIKDQSPNSGNLQLFSVFAEQIPVAAAMLDRDLRYLIVSRRWLIDYELQNQDIIGRYHFEIFPLLQKEGMGSGEWRMRDGEEGSESPAQHSKPFFPPPFKRWQEIFASCLAGTTHLSHSDYFIKSDGGRQKVKWRSS